MPWICGTTNNFENDKKTDNKPEHKIMHKHKAEEVTKSAPVEKADDDTELIAVIAAAIAASENTTTDSFVVRSIRRRF